MTCVTRYLWESDEDIVSDFCKKCSELGYENNSSLKAMKWDWNEVQWVGTFTDKLVSLSGIHAFPEMGSNAFRVMFRGASLPGISRTFLNFKQIPLKVEWALLNCDDPVFYVTFNTTGRSKRMGNAIARRKDFTYIKNMIYFNVEQEIWKYDYQF